MQGKECMMMQPLHTFSLLCGKPLHTFLHNVTLSFDLHQYLRAGM
jgi:hypothetical protein